MATMCRYVMLAFVLEAALLIVVQGTKCNVNVNGVTWNFVPGRDIFSLGIPTEEDCRELCLAKPECKGYSWKFDDVIGWCYEFAELESIHVCEDCYSGTVPQKFNGVCAANPENVISLVSSDTSEECYRACIGTEGCVGYSWLDSTTLFPNYCYLYNECSTVDACSGCFGGSPNCARPMQCFDYLNLDSVIRNENSISSADVVCDQEGYIRPSIDWRGSGNYRVVPPAGVRLSTKYPGKMHCGGYFASWVKDDNNELIELKVGQELKVTVCMSSYDEVDATKCDKPLEAVVTKCPGDFFVYSLKDVRYCHETYCGSMDPL